MHFIKIGEDNGVKENNVAEDNDADKDNKSIVCYYHGIDSDGFLSAAILKQQFKDAKLMPINYGLKINDEDVNGKTVYMVDFSMPVDEMKALDKKCDLIWIDHHKSAIDAANKGNFDPKGLRVDGEAGCELTWKFLHSKEDMPEVVTLIGRYDVWDLKDPDVIKFQYGAKGCGQSPDGEFWKKMLEDEKGDEIKKVIEKGSIILGYVNEENKKYCKEYSFDTELDGHKAICCNSGFKSSQLFESVWDKNKYDIMLGFCWMPTVDKYTVSVYTDKEDIDCSIICKKHGGGGHKGAAGFQCKELPFKLNKKENNEKKNT